MVSVETKSKAELLEEVERLRAQLTDVAGTESETRFRILADVVPTIIWMSNTRNECVYVNKPWLNFTGRTMEEELGQGWTDRLHPADQEASMSVANSAVTAKEPFQVECRMQRHDGEYRWMLNTGAPRFTPQSDLVGYVGSCVDITDRKIAEEKLEAEDLLLRRLLEMRERERKMVAYDIHDGLVQHLVGASMLLESLAFELDDQDDANFLLATKAREQIRQAIDEARRLINDQRPLIIDERGIVAAIEFLIAENTDEKLEISFVNEAEFERLAHLLESVIFRIVQEALNNVRRHSQATKLEVKLSHVHDRLRIEISDNGIGFNVDDVPASHYGLESIRQRARLFQGTVVIDSTPGKGTKVVAELPILLTE